MSSLHTKSRRSNPAYEASHRKALARRQAFLEWVQQRGGADWLREIKAHGGTARIVAAMSGAPVKTVEDVAGEIGVWMPRRPVTTERMHPVPLDLQRILIRTHDAHPDVPVETLVSAALEALRVQNPSEDKEVTRSDA